MSIMLLPGGAQAALTTTEAAVDLTALVGRTVMIWCDDGDVWLSGDADGTGTLVTAGASAASLTSLKADRVAKGTKVPRKVAGTNLFVIAKMVTGTGTLHVKVVSDVDGPEAAAEQASPGPVGTTTVSGTVSTIQGSPAKTDNTTYIATGNMSADVDGAAITVGPEGRLLLELSWTNTGSPIGTFVLQGLLPSGGYDDIPTSSSAFLRHPNNDTNTSVAYFTQLQVFTSVRLKYRRTSGGTANTSLDVNIRTT